MFPVNSTSVETAAIHRICRVIGRTKVSQRIASGSVFDCRVVVGTSTYSQHAWGNAVDLFPKSPSGNDAADRQAIAYMVVRLATHRTMKNRFRRLPVAQVIDHDAHAIWEPATGWREYTGATGDHVHVSGAPMRTGRPPCA